MFGSQSGLFSCVLNMMAVHQSPLVSCWQLDASCDIHSIQCVSAVHSVCLCCACMHLYTCFWTAFSVLPAVLTDLFCLFRGIVGYMMEHEDVIKIPVNLKELQGKIKYAQTQLSQV